MNCIICTTTHDVDPVTKICKICTELDRKPPRKER